LRTGNVMAITKKISLILADDHPLFLEGLISVLKREFLITGSTGNGKELQRLLESNKPDVVIICLNNAMVDGLSTCRQIAKYHPAVKSIILSFFYDEQIEQQLKTEGVKGYFTKDIQTDALIEAIKCVAGGGIAFSVPQDKLLSEARRIISNYDAFVDHYKLSPRELKIISLIRDGLTSNEISGLLFISINTVESHRKNIFKKLNLKNIQGLVEFAYKHSL